MLSRFVICLAVGAVGCGRPTPTAPAAAAFFAEPGAPLPGLGADVRERFEKGREVFTRGFAPGDGLGPAYSAATCAACHRRPALGGTAGRYRQVFVHARAPDAFRVTFQPQFSTAPDRPLALTPEGTSTAVRQPMPFFGVGLLAEIPTDEILTRVDPNDADGDGISGRVNFERGHVGRFGRKAQVAGLLGFVRLALVDHLGLTTDPVDVSDLPEAEAPAELPSLDRDDVRDPEVPNEDLANLMAFVALLAPPAPDPPSPITQQGAAELEALGCTSCHVPALDGPRGPVPAYTDLLLHDMGQELADAVEVGAASGSEFRTPPLWGIAAAGPYLHDGRADTLDQAIRAHGGEAQPARERYEALGEARRSAVLAFLRSLGGGAVRPDGLLPAHVEPPAPGTLGGPSRELDLAEQRRFVDGQVLFDREVGVSSGLGPSFNGDSCRACHSSAAMGGAGPRDVDVIRAGRLLADGTFLPPTSGSTLAHRHGTAGRRPELERDLDLFERRQTQPLFGLGLIEAVDDELIAARADPDDADGDGVRGRLHRLSDGRIGRFGWKADVATVAEFVAGALSGELGLTVPDEVRGPTAAGAGVSRDADAAADPEVTPRDFDALRFFVAELAPPPRRSTDPQAEARGERQFQAFGCAACHVPELMTRDGRVVPLYSDLLLHDVAPAAARRVVDPVAGRALRTPPLWGLTRGAPYLHDGSAETLEQAISSHDGEAASSARRWSAASAAERKDLLRFLDSL